MFSRTIEESLGIGDKNHGPLAKDQICKAKEVMIKSKDPVPNTPRAPLHFPVSLVLGWDHVTSSGQWAVNRSDMYHTSGPKYLRVGMCSLYCLPCPSVILPISHFKFQSALEVTSVQNRHQPTERMEVPTQISCSRTHY